jgi:hypothetical protein
MNVKLDLAVGNNVAQFANESLALSFGFHFMSTAFQVALKNFRARDLNIAQLAGEGLQKRDATTVTQKQNLRLCRHPLQRDSRVI